MINSDNVGMLVDAEDERSLELALRKLLLDPKLRRSLGKQLQKRVSDEFTWQRAWQEYLALVRNDRSTSEPKSFRGSFHNY